MPSDRIVVEGLSMDEQIAAAFARPLGETSSGQLVPVSGPLQMTVSDAIITAQKVAVERDDGNVLRKIKAFAAAAGEDWYYRWKTKDRGRETWVEGPSIKCANNVARFYGNCQVDTRVVDNGDSWIIYARFVDYETGFSYTRPFQQRKAQGTFKTADSGRLLDMALQIGVSKAIRNVICNALESFTTFAFEEARNSIVEKVGKDIERYRNRVVQRLGEMNIAVERVEFVVGRAHKDWLATDVSLIIAEIQAINDGMATIDETWPPLAAPERPTRDDVVTTTEPSAGDTARAAEVVWDVVDMVGEDKQYTDLDAALAAYNAALDEGEQQKGREGLRTVSDNNGTLFSALEERGFANISKELSMDIGNRMKVHHDREAAAAAAQTSSTEAAVTGGSGQPATEIPRGIEPAQSGADRPGADLSPGQNLRQDATPSPRNAAEQEGPSQVSASLGGPDASPPVGDTTAAAPVQSAAARRNAAWWGRDRLAITEHKSNIEFVAHMHQRLHEADCETDVDRLSDDNGILIDELPKASRADVLTRIAARRRQLR